MGHQSSSLCVVGLPTYSGVLINDHQHQICTKHLTGCNNNFIEYINPNEKLICDTWTPNGQIVMDLSCSSCEEYTYQRSPMHKTISIYAGGRYLVSERTKWTTAADVFQIENLHIHPLQIRSAQISHGITKINGIKTMVIYVIPVGQIREFEYVNYDNLCSHTCDDNRGAEVFASCNQCGYVKNRILRTGLQYPYK